MLENLVTGEEIKRAWKKSGESKAVFAAMLGLKNRSTLTQLMNGHSKYIKPSLKLSLKVRGIVLGKKPIHTNLLSSIDIPSGTILPSNADVHTCEDKTCHQKFIRMNSRRKYHSHACQCRAWRKRRKGK